MKYYSVNYNWRHPKLAKTYSASTFTDIHPLNWVKWVNNADGMGFEYTLVSYKEITKDMYDKYKGTEKVIN